MERILCILVLVTVIFGGDALLVRNPVAHRYGGGGVKRPSFGGPIGGNGPSYGPPSGGSSGPYGTSGGNLEYGASNVVASSSYGGSSYSSSYNAPSGSFNGQIYNTVSSGSYGQPSYNLPSVSYNRPFGLPEGQKFPNGGFTYKFPNDRPPRPPMKSSYISKPYPDFIVRFKSPLYPSQVSVYDKPQQSSSYPAPPPPPPPVYEPGETIAADIPIYGADKVQLQQQPPLGVNVGASYQAGAVGGSVTSLNSPSAPFVSQDVVLPPSTSIYILSSSAVAADKLHVDTLDSFLASNGSGGVQNAYIELSKESAFGSTPEPGVIKPLTPDIVYSPEKNDEFKPMYIFGPMYFPKSEEDLKKAAENDTVESKSKNECVETDPANPKCSLKSDEEVTVAPSSKPTAEASAPVAAAAAETSSDDDEKSTAGDSDANTSPLDDEADDEEGGRGLLGVLKGILGVDDHAVDDDEEHVSRVDGQKKSQKGNSRPVANEDEEEGEEVDPEEDQEENAPPKRRRRPTTTTRERNQLRKGSSKSSSSSRFSNSGKKSSSSGGFRGTGSSSRFRGTGSSGGSRVTGSSGGSRGAEGSRPETVGSDQAPEQLENDEEEEKKTDDRNSATGEDSEPLQPTGFEPNQAIEGDQPDPVVGPVQIGYIGGPPPGAPYNPYQPFFYPAGIPAFDHNPLGPGPDPPMFPPGPDGNGGNRFEADHTRQPEEIIPNREDVVDDNVRRHFHGSDATDNSVHYSGNEDDNRPPVNGPPFDDRPPSDGSFYNGPVPEEGFRNPSAAFGPQSHRDYEPDTAAQNHPEGQRLDYGSSDKSNVVDSNTVDDGKMYDYTSSQTPKSDSHTTTESGSHDVTTSNSYSTYPHTSSYSSNSDTDDTTVTTSYANSGDDRHEEVTHVTHDQPTSSQTTSYLHVDEHVSEDPYVMSSESSAYEPLSKNELSHDVTSTAGGDHYQSGSSSSSASIAHDSDDSSSTANSYQSTESHDATSSNDGFTLESSSTSETSHAYASVTRRPFPSFYKYRTSYRPKDRNYVAPTTYRPALRIASSTEKDDVLLEEKDVSATIHNSVNENDDADDDVVVDSSSLGLVTVSPVIDSVASYNLETANSEPLVQIRESPVAPFGSRIRSKAHSDQ